MSNDSDKESKETPLPVNIFRLSETSSFDLNQMFSFDFIVSAFKYREGHLFPKYKGFLKLSVITRDNNVRIFKIGEVGDYFPDSESAEKEAAKTMHKMHKDLIRAWSNN